MLIALIVIIYVMANEYRKRKRVKGIIEYFETDNSHKLSEEQMFIIEQKAQIAVRDYKPFWNKFNTAKYVEFLEYKYSNE